MLHCNRLHLVAKVGIAIGCGKEPRNGGYAGAALMFVTAGLMMLGEFVVNLL